MKAFRFLSLALCTAALLAPGMASLAAQGNDRSPLAATSGTQRIRWSVWPILIPGPVPSPDWWRGTWGGQLTFKNLRLLSSQWNLELNAAEVLGGILTSTTTLDGPVFGNDPSLATYLDAKLAGTHLPGKHWQYLLRYQGLLPHSGGTGLHEAALGLSWKYDPDVAPWFGPVATGVGSLGSEGATPYGSLQWLGSWYLQGPSGLILVPTLIAASVVGNPNRYPPDRLLSVRDGASLVTHSLIARSIDASHLRSSFLGGAVSLRFPIAPPLIPWRGVELRPYLGINSWAAAENLIARPAWLSPVGDGGISLAIALVDTVADRPGGSPMVLKIASRFADLSRPANWRFSMLFSTGVFPTGPQSGVDWYW